MNFVRIFFATLAVYALGVCTHVQPSLAQVGAGLPADVDVIEGPEEPLTAEEFDDTPDTPSQAKLSPEMRKAFSEFLKQPTDSPLMQKLTTMIEHPSPTPTPSARELPVIKHLVSKDDGVAFPDPAPLRAKMTAQEKEVQVKTDALINSDAFDEAGQKIIEAQDHDQFAEATPPPLPSCPLDLTRVVPLEDGDSTKISPDEKVISDFLMVRSEPPLNSETAFGQGTNVVHYTVTKGDYLSLVVAMEGMPCLPYRIRLTSKHVIHDLGLPALKNYDHNPKGELYEGIKERLGEYR